MKNKDIQKIYIALQVILLFILPTILFFIGIFCLKTQQSKIALMAIYTLFLIGLAIYLTIILQRYFKNSILAKKSLEFYLQSEFNQFGTGILIFLNSGKIIWASESLKIKFHNNLINKNIKDIFNIKQWTSDNQEFMYEIDECNYEVHISFEKNLVILRDVTAQQNLLDDYKKQRIVFGELDIDNINLYQTFLSQEEIFKIISSDLKSVDVNILKKLTDNLKEIKKQKENDYNSVVTSYLKEKIEETITKNESIIAKKSNIESQNIIETFVLLQKLELEFAYINWTELNLIAKIKNKLELLIKINKIDSNEKEKILKPWTDSFDSSKKPEIFELESILKELSKSLKELINK